MKEILQTKYFKHIFISACVVCSVIHARASFYVDTTAQGRQLTVAKEPGPEDQQEPQYSEPEQYEGADQGQAYDYYDYTNSSDQQGKHRFILNQSRTSFES